MTTAEALSAVPYEGEAACDPKQQPVLAAVEATEPFTTTLNPYGRRDMIIGFVSSNPAVLDAKGNLEYFDC